jgi:hypothetical protein
MVLYNKVPSLHSTKNKTSYFSHESHQISIDLIKHFGKKIGKPQSTPFPQNLRQEKKTFISKSATTWTKEFFNVDFAIPHI